MSERWEVRWELLDGNTQDSIEYNSFEEACNGFDFYRVEHRESIRWIQMERL